MRECLTGAAPGQLFPPWDFPDLGSRAAVDQALSRLCRDGHLRRVGRGLYALPRQHPLFGELAVTSDAIAEALAGRDALRLQPAGAYAANQLGLTEQVPMRLLFLTDGPTRTLRLADGREIVLKQTTPRFMQTAGRISGTVIAALRWLGRDAVDDDTIRGGSGQASWGLRLRVWRVAFAQQRRDVSPTVQDAPDVELPGVVHVEDQIRRLLDRPVA